MKVRGLNVVFLVFSLLVLAGSAILITNRTNLKSEASNVTQTATGKLVKKGSSDFSPCGSNVNFTYGLIGGQVQGVSIALTLPTPTPYPKLTPSPIPTTKTYYTTPTPYRYPTPSPYIQTPSPTPISTPKTSACVPLIITSSLANPLVGQKVVVTGTFQNGVFYATAIKKSSTSTSTPKSTSRIRVIAPNGGEKLVRGQNYTITWSATSDIAAFGIYVINTNGQVSYVNGLQAPTKSYNWVADPPVYVSDPALYTNSYKIKVCDANDQICDTSDKYFTISPN